MRIEYRPKGYAFFLNWLYNGGLLSSAAIVLFNILFFSAAAWLFSRMARNIFSLSKNGALVLLIVILLSWINIKHVTLSVPEMIFLFFAMLSLWLLYRFEEKKNFFYLAAAIATSLLSVKMRTVGIALFPAIAWALIYAYRQKLASIYARRRRIILFSVPITLVFFAGAIIIFREPLGIEGYILNNEVLRINNMLRSIKYAVTEIGEGGLNISYSKIYAFIPGAASNILFSGFGTVCALLLLLHTCSRRKELRSSDIFFLCYIVIVFTWPYYDSRFVLPAIPYFAAVAISYYEKLRSRLLIYLARAYFILFCIAGAAALYYSTSLSLNEKKFASDYSPSYRGTYEYYMNLSAAPAGADPLLMHMLTEYNGDKHKEHSGSKNEGRP
jgi:4-amino-4-deoxy-L-arabinose transferase-like glycosyltransferase